MTKKELVVRTADKAGVAKKIAEETVNAMLEIIEETLEKNEKVQLIGFGTFEVQQRKARTCKNLHTGEIMKLERTNVPKFRPGKKLRETIKTV